MSYNSYCLEALIVNTEKKSMVRLITEFDQCGGPVWAFHIVKTPLLRPDYCFNTSRSSCYVKQGSPV